MYPVNWKDTPHPHKSQEPKSRLRIRKEFRQKNTVLSTLGTPVAPMDYISSIWGENDIISCGPWGVTVVPHEDHEDIFSLSPVDQIFTPYCTFFRNYYSKKTARQLLCLVVDIEYVTPKQVENIVQKLKGTTLEPTYIVNSGRGIHFVYQLQKPVEAYSKVKPFIGKLLRALCARINRKFADLHLEIDYPASCDFIHAFRVPGTQTKIGEVATAFRIGEKVDIYTIARSLRLKAPLLEKKPKPRRVQRERKIVTSPDAPNGHPRFYEYCLRKLQEEMKTEYRYMALFALAIVGWKCRIPEEQVRYDLISLQERWNEYALRKGMPTLKNKEIEKAMKGYDQKYTKVTSRILADWLGVTFKTNKRNGRKRRDHLNLVAKQKRKSSIEKIWNVLVEAKRKRVRLTITKLAYLAGVSRRTVYNRLSDLGISVEEVRKGTYILGENKRVQLIDIIPPLLVSSTAPRIQKEGYRPHISRVGACNIDTKNREFPE